MPSDTHRHDHDHAEDAQTSGGSCCGSAGTCGDTVPATPAPAGGRSFQVSGLDCAEEVAILNKVVGPKIGGAEHLAFDVINGRMTILDSAKSVSDGEIAELVASTGMTAKPWDAENASVDQAAHLARQRLFTALSGGFWAAGFLWHIIETGMGGALGLFAGHGEAPMPLVEAGLFAVAILFGVWLVAPKAWSSARRLSPDMNLLMVVAVAGAIGLGEFFEAATVAFFFSLSLFLESWSVGRARNAVSALLDLAPPTARILYDDGSEADVPASAVAINALFVVRGGDRIPLDGEVVDGAGAVDQAPITGESALVPKERGDEVYAGTINGEGTLTVRATKAASDTVLAKIIRMVGDAHARRAPVEQWVAKFARIYTPIVMALAIAIALLPPLIFGGAWDYWFYNALVLLVIACPCALVISTPVSIVAALTASARAGVLIKGGAYVEAPGKTTALAMDKTGTITMGEPEVAAVHPLGKASAQDLMTLAAGLEARSSHPLARAILARAEADGIKVFAAEDTRTVPGRGLEGRTDGRSIWLGSDRFAEEKGFGDAIPKDLRNRIEGAGSTLVAVGDDTGVTGILELRDRIRPDAKGIVAQLHAQGVKTIVMLTGDNERTARAVAAEVGIDEVRAELLPEDKVTAIEELVETHDMVAMIGDGVNDAPAMARAHYAIAMGAVGSDAAIETADIALMTDDLGKVPWLIGHSRRTMSIIHQNIGISLATKGVFVVATAFGVASMWGAIAADVGVSLLVVANALRLLNSQEAKAPPSGGEQVGEGLAKGALAHGH
ncbi:heavy metal translocating P-type ATPase [Donghicola tyrosinivorans]|jgi:Cd2+/Zn2+-exporting ATPase|uniref:P-type Zn(2+) transporter n=1 Tax=Donghicola tyrosinivorans TaxID=1652492 RepID=A0A2T0WCS5_9RHOB|nr:cation-translocating P-type ATPase [Donghicola tyrosinivorans]MAJ64531.1 heavy metal translocating P-type ATPase [Alphaproteobacteria bacterium]MBN56262.1 heavy metal translocating P-type ATPase [Oceanospirillaceae bacterium]OUT40317.1 MAG: heavy metal translocating P-type ATPase [Micavibrio sp. TMED2]PRY84508.1 Cd2+/Zn2+-exporting ATPase [Donghicola tyrosinivorans]|tara:strand:+ start:1241 stop:3595 length:2355 start_codon:yes stop_codon:yes gene_type:complete